MPFQSIISLLHIVSLALAIGAFLVMLRQLGLRTLSDASRATLVFNIRATSYIMLLGIFLACITAGAFLAYGILTTSQLPQTPVLLIRGLTLFGVIVSSVFLHIHAMMMLGQAQGRKIVDSVAASRIIACALAASLAILCWSLWILSGIPAARLDQLAAGEILPASAVTVAFLWSMLTTLLLGERGYRELKALALYIKKRLTPPTPLERQRMARERRLQHMRLPMAPRRKMVA